jgi:hypothetical protein
VLRHLGRSHLPSAERRKSTAGARDLRDLRGAWRAEARGARARQRVSSKPPERRGAPIPCTSSCAAASTSRVFERSLRLREPPDAQRSRPRAPRPPSSVTYQLEAKGQLQSKRWPDRAQPERRRRASG